MSAADEYAISVAKTEYREGHNTGDVARVLSVFADSFTNMPEGEPSFYGEEAKQALRAQLSKLFALYEVRMEVVIIDIAICGNTAIDRGWLDLRTLGSNAFQFLVAQLRQPARATNAKDDRRIGLILREIGKNWSLQSRSRSRR